MGSRREVEKRQHRVLQMYLRGLDADQIAAKTEVHKATIYRDLEELRILIAQKIDAESLWPIRKAVAMRDELIRCAWRLHDLKPPKRRKIWSISTPMKDSGARITAGKEEIEFDTSKRKLAALHEVGVFSSQLDKLAFPDIMRKLVQTPPEQGPQQEANQQLLDKKIAELNPDERTRLFNGLKVLRKLGVNLRVNFQ